ncbi:MAG TPA: ester cyclase [Ktedonobacteraceae bacterium]|nr:ester cyclase [Ktedonobacteraceae bacterium]
MSTEDNKALVRRFYTEVLEKRNPALVDELFATTYVYHYPDMPPDLPSGLEGFKKFVTLFLSGFSNLTFTIDDQTVEGDKVVTRVTGHSSNIGAMRAAPNVSQAETEPHPEVSSNVAETTSIHGTSTDRIANGKIVETWAKFNLPGAEEELGGNAPAGEVK